MAKSGRRWTKWWWLGFFGVQTWTVEERRARIALQLTMLACMIATLWIAGTILEWLGMERHRAATLAALMAVVVGFPSARPIARVLYPDLLAVADRNAEERLNKQRTV